VRIAQEADAKIVMDSDAHAPEDLLTREFAMKVALGAGLDEDEAYALLDTAPRNVLARLGVEHP
jgi:histidinol phosphatase-like PHP family hydrolase